MNPLVALTGFLFGLGLTPLIGHTWPLHAFPLTRAAPTLLGGVAGAILLTWLHARLGGFVARLASQDAKGPYPKFLSLKERDFPMSTGRALAWAWLPLALVALDLALQWNLRLHSSPGIDIARGWALVLGGGLLALAFTIQSLAQWRLIAPSRWAAPLAAALIAGIVFLRTMGTHVGQADTFEFQVTAYSLGVAHPTGYPLYVLLGHAFAWLIPVGSVAWRVNLTATIPAALAVGGATWLARRMGAGGVIAALAALTLAFSPTFWRAATAAEVYALHALLVVLALGALYELVAGRAGESIPRLRTKSPLKWTRINHHTMKSESTSADLSCLASWHNPGGNKRSNPRLVYLLAATLGLGLAHHLTIVLLFPAAILALLIARPRLTRRQWATAAGIGLAGAALTLVIPLRWPGLTGEAMSLDGFFAYVTGQQFAGALQWGLLGDPARWAVVGRIILGQFGVVGLALAGLGAVLTLVRRPLWGAITALVAITHLVYGLAYNVPDVGVFLLPVSIVGALWVAVGATFLANQTGLMRRETVISMLVLAAVLLGLISIAIGCTLPDIGGFIILTGMAWVTFIFELGLVGSLFLYAGSRRHKLIVAMLALLPITLLITHWDIADRSRDDGGEAWARQVIATVAEDAVILADGEKIAPLEYLHRVEELGPDMSMVVRGDEAGYRESLNLALAQGRPVYLARPLPGLEGEFHLRSAGPVVEVGRAPITELPPEFAPLEVVFSGEIALVGVHLPDGDWREGTTAPVTLAWTRLADEVGRYEVRLRLRDVESGAVVWQEAAFAVAGTYPTNAWKGDEIVVDAHAIPLAHGLAVGGPVILEVGVFPPYGEAWQGLLASGSEGFWVELATVEVAPDPETPLPSSRVDVEVEPGLLLLGYDAPDVFPEDSVVPAALYWLTLRSGDYSATIDAINFSCNVVCSTSYDRSQVDYGTLGRGDRRVTPLTMNVRTITSRSLDVELYVNDVHIMTFPVEEAPPTLANFAGLFALEAASLSTGTATPGSGVEVVVTWTARVGTAEDYTVFVQVIGPDGALWGQVDTYPLQGTLPTSNWPPGETIQDRYALQVRHDAPPGTYRVIIGFYLLRTGERLDVLDAAGAPIGDFYGVGTVNVE